MANERKSPEGPLAPRGQTCHKDMLIDAAKNWSATILIAAPTSTTPINSSASVPAVIVAPRSRPLSPKRIFSAITKRSAITARSNPSTAPYMGKDTHAISSPAQCTALEVLAANDVETIIQRQGRRHAHAGHFSGHPRPQSWPQRPFRRWHRHHPFPQSSPQDGGFKYNPPNGGLRTPRSQVDSGSRQRFLRAGKRGKAHTVLLGDQGRAPPTRKISFFHM